MFFDLVGSTTLSGQLDPEELRDLVQAYQKTCNDVVSRFQGHVAQYLGDGILVYFGYPQAHPDDGARGVGAALEIIKAMAELNQQLPAGSPRLDLRVGIHTGLVVVGQLGSREHSENLAMGETPNVAARLQGLAGINEVVISSTTLELVQDAFQVQSLGHPTLKGVTQPIEVFRVVGRSQARERRQMDRQRRSSTPFVGRQEELQSLRRLWSQAQEGCGQAVQVVGPTGIGKSRLLQEFKNEILASHPFLLSSYPEPEQTGQAWSAVAQWLRRELEFCPDSLPPLEKLRHAIQTRAPRLSLPVAWPVLARLLQWAEPEGFELPPTSPQALRHLTQETLTDFVLALAAQKPLFLLVEGVDWLDSSSAEWLAHLARVVGQHPVLLLLVGRKSTSLCDPVVELGPLQPEQARQLLAAILAGREEPNRLLERAQGIPLYLEELARASLQAGLPGRLQDLLMARLDELGEHKQVCQVASVVGRTFSTRLVQALMQKDIRHSIEALQQKDVLCRASEGGEWTFTQALMREVSYESLLKASRQEYHAKLVEILAEQFPAWSEHNPGVVAHHASLSKERDKAVSWYRQLALRSLACSALPETVDAASKGLELLDALPAEHPAQLHRLALYAVQGGAWIGLKGYGCEEVAQCYGRARQVCLQAGDGPEVFPILAGLWGFHFSRGQLDQALGISQRLYEVGQQQGGESRTIAAATLGQTCFFLGQFERSLPLLQEAIQDYRPERETGASLACLLTQTAVASCSYLSLLHHLEDRLEAAEHCRQQALQWAQELAHPHTLVHTLAFDCWLDALRLSPELGQRAQALAQMAHKQGFPLWGALAEIFAGLAEVSPQRLQNGLAEAQKCGASVGSSWALAQLARTLGQLEQREAALGLLEMAEQSQEGWYRPQIALLRAELSRA